MLRFVGHVNAKELEGDLGDVIAHAKGLSRGFQLLGDFTDLQRMDPDCAAPMGKSMDSLKEAGVAKIIRVMPDPSKDIGLSILTAFHYPRDVRVLTCKSMIEAADLLAL